MKLLDEERLHLRHKSVITCLSRMEERFDCIDERNFIDEVVPSQVLLNFSVFCAQNVSLV